MCECFTLTQFEPELCKGTQEKNEEHFMWSRKNLGYLGYKVDDFLVSFFVGQDDYCWSEKVVEFWS